MKADPILNAQYGTADGRSGHIVCLKVEPDGFTFQRLHESYNKETWKMRTDVWQKSFWVEVKGQFQLL